MRHKSEFYAAPVLQALQYGLGLNVCSYSSLGIAVFQCPTSVPSLFLALVSLKQPGKKLRAGYQGDRL